MKKYTLLLTGTIDSSKFTNKDNAIPDTLDRLRQYENAITRYIKESAFNEIVFADNSGYDFDYEKFEDLAKQYNKKFEFCSVTKYVKPELGKGYGDCQIIWEALETSRILSEAETIYKLTGRIFMTNSKKVVRTVNSHKNEFLMYDKDKWCYTYILKFNKQDYIKYFSDSMDIMSKAYLPIEMMYYPIVLKMIEDGADVGAFKTWPCVIGIQGYSGGTYGNSFKGKVYHNILCKLGAYNTGSPFQKYIRH